MKNAKNNIGKLGWATIGPIKNIIAGSKGTWKIKYTIGSKEIGVGGIIKIGHPLMSNLSILGEKRFHLSQQSLILIGGDGASWIKEEAQNYFPDSVYQLDKFHLECKLKQTPPIIKKYKKK